MSLDEAHRRLRLKVIGAFGGDGVAITEILLRANALGLVNQVCSKPPSGMCKVVELYVNPSTGGLVIVYDDTPVGG